MRRFASIVKWVKMGASGALLLAGSTALASQTASFNVNMTGQKEIVAGLPNGGDLDGSAVGLITLNSAAGTISWNLTLSNLFSPAATDFHIHTGASNVSGGVLIPLGIPAGSTLDATSFIGTKTGISGATMDSVLANPNGFYFNIHNGQFPGGAIRDQVPEPSTLALLGLPALALLKRNRRAK